MIDNKDKIHDNTRRGRSRIRGAFLGE